MSRVLILSLVYRPDTVSTANMITDISQGLQASGHDVTVLTSVPHYNPSIDVRNNPRYRATWWLPFTESFEQGVRVLRVFMPLKRHKVWARALDYILFQFLTTVLGLFVIERPDVVFVTSPPITLGLSGIMISKFHGSAFIYDVRELWPDVPVRMGLISQTLLIRLVYALEDFVYSKAAAISSIARSFQDRLVERGVPPVKLYFTPNFVNVSLIRPSSRDNQFSRDHGLVGEFVVLYAGNVGLTQGLEILIDVASGVSEDSQIRFLVVGDGAGRKTLEHNISRSGLSSISLLPFQPEQLVNEMYASADICIAPLLRGFAYDTVPSKIYTSMAAGRPVVASAEKDTETDVLLRESDAGICVPPESVTDLITSIRSLRSDPDRAARLGGNGRQWIIKNYSRDTVIKLYETMVQDVSLPEA